MDNKFCCSGFNNFLEEKNIKLNTIIHAGVTLFLGSPTREHYMLGTRSLAMAWNEANRQQGDVLDWGAGNRGSIVDILQLRRTSSHSVSQNT